MIVEELYIDMDFLWTRKAFVMLTPGLARNSPCFLATATDPHRLRIFGVILVPTTARESGLSRYEPTENALSMGRNSFVS